MKRILPFILTLASFSSLHAETRIEAEGRSYYASCHYYTSTDAEIRIHYFNDRLPWGTRLQLEWSRAGKNRGPSERTLAWFENRTTEMFATSDFTWTADLSYPLMSRSSPEAYTSLEFVVKILNPEGAVEYDNGGLDPWGHYKVSLQPIMGHLGCYEENLPWKALVVEAERPN